MTDSILGVASRLAKAKLPGNDLRFDQGRAGLTC
jgi:hypothetical protein